MTKREEIKFWRDKEKCPRCNGETEPLYLADGVPWSKIYCLTCNWYFNREEWENSEDYD